MNNKKLFSVIIVNYNSMDLLKQCLKSIHDFNDIGDALEVIVVDNSDVSSDSDYFFHNMENIVYVKNENKGFGHANNVGAKLACGNYLLFLNPDTILVEPIFKDAVRKFKNNSSIGMFGYKLTDINGRQIFSYGFRKASWGFIRALLYQIIRKLDLFIPSVMFTSGADIFIKRNLFFEIGGFDENIFLYNEEADLSNRLNLIDKKVGYFKDKSIIHLEGQTESNGNSKFKWLAKSYMYYCQKYNIDFNKYARFEFRKVRILKWACRILGIKKFAFYDSLAKCWTNYFKMTSK